MKKITLAATLMMTTFTLSQADILNGEVAIGGWHHNPGGWIKYPNYLGDQNRLDADDDLNLDTQTDIYLRTKLEHPLPLLPNIRIAYNHTESSGDGQINRSITFGNILIGVNDPIYSEAKLDNYDATLYYQLLDTGLDIDVGLTARYINGYVKIQDKRTGADDTTDIDFIVPMVYGNLRIPIPFIKGLSIGGEGNWITYDGSTLYDLQADARYLFSIGLGLEIGYRYQKIKLDDIDDTDADLDIQGVYAGLIWAF